MRGERGALRVQREDLLRIEAVIAVAGSGANVCVNANGRFDLQTAVDYAQAMAPYGLRWYEEAGDPLGRRASRPGQRLTANCPTIAAEDCSSRVMGLAFWQTRVATRPTHDVSVAEGTMGRPRPEFTAVQDRSTCDSARYNQIPHATSCGGRPWS